MREDGSMNVWKQVKASERFPTDIPTMKPLD